MDFLKDLAEWGGELRASSTRPVYQMRMELEREMKRREIAEAFDQVVGLRQQLQEQGEAFGDEQKLRLFQAMGQAGIDPQKMASTNLEQLREQAFTKAMTGMDNPYALGNLANKLDVAPTKHVGGVTYNRFDPTTESILHMTEAVRGEGRKKIAEADIKEAQAGVLVDFLNNPQGNQILKVDAANDKPITKTSKAVYIDETGNRQEYDQILNPDGSWSYRLAADNEGKPFTVPPDENRTSQITNINDLISRGVSEAKALEMVYSSKGKTDQQLYEESTKMAANSSMTGFGANLAKVRTMSEELFRIMRPGGQLPSEMIDKVNSGSSRDNDSDQDGRSPALKAPTGDVIKSAKHAISRGADPRAIAKRLQENGYSTDGIF